MTRQRFYPYKIASSLQLRVDATEPAHEMDPNARYLRLWETEGTTWQVTATVDVPAGVVAQVLPADEHATLPLETVLVLRSRTSRRRQALRQPFQIGTTTFDIDIDRDDWTGLVEVEVHVVRTEDSESSGRHARSRNMVVATGEGVRIDIDEPRRPPGDSLQIEWHDFSDSNIAWLKQHSANLFALRRSATAEPPILYLNQGFEHAVSILNQTGRTGYKARARDMMFSLIAHQVWSSVLSSCLSELRDSAGDDVPMDEAMDSLPYWMPPVIRDWAPWLFPTASKRDALDLVWQHVLKGDWEELLTEQLPNAIQTQFETFGSLSGMAQEIGL